MNILEPLFRSYFTIMRAFSFFQDAVNMVCNSKTRANPENTVALLTLGSLKVLSTLTNEVGKVNLISWMPF